MNLTEKFKFLDDVTNKTTLFDRMFTKEMETMPVVEDTLKDLPTDPLFEEEVKEEPLPIKEDEVIPTERATTLSLEAAKSALKLIEKRPYKYMCLILSQNGRLYFTIRKRELAEHNIAISTIINEFDSKIDSWKVGVNDLVDMEPYFKRYYIPIESKESQSIIVPELTKPFELWNAGTIPYHLQADYTVLEGNMSRDTMIALVNSFAGIVPGLSVVTSKHFYPNQPHKDFKYPIWLVWSGRDKDRDLSKVIPPYIKIEKLDAYPAIVDYLCNDVLQFSARWRNKLGSNLNLKFVRVDKTPIGIGWEWDVKKHGLKRDPLYKPIFPELEDIDPDDGRKAFGDVMEVVTKLGPVLGLIPGYGQMAQAAITTLQTLNSLMQTKGVKISDIVPRTLPTEFTGDIVSIIEAASEFSFIRDFDKITKNWMFDMAYDMVRHPLSKDILVWMLLTNSHHFSQNKLYLMQVTKLVIAKCEYWIQKLGEPVLLNLIKEDFDKINKLYY